MALRNESDGNEFPYVSLSLLMEQGDHALKCNGDNTLCIDCKRYMMGYKVSSQKSLIHQHNTFLLFGVLPLPTSTFIYKKMMEVFQRIFCRIKPLPCWGTCGPYHHLKTCTYHPLQGGLPYRQVKRSLSMEF